METSKSWFGQSGPVLLERQGGGWLAVSGEGAIVPIGVVGSTREEALRRFEIAAWEWSLLLDRRDQDMNTR
jgi:hypothetical protein